MTLPSKAPLSATQLLLNLLNPGQTASQWQAEFLALGANWDDLAVRAIVFGLAPQVFARANTLGLTLPDRARAKLAATHQASSARNAAIYQQLGEVLQALAEEQLSPIALKGVHLAALVYADPALRPMNDIDLLFTPEALPQAEAVLQKLGYGGKYKPASLGAGVTKHTATYRRDSGEAATPNPYLSPESDRMIEPHSSLEESWFGLRVDITPGVRQRAQAAQLSGQPCLVLSAADLVLHLSVHFCFHLIMGAPSMVQLTDLLAVTQRLSVDWEQVGQRAVDCRAAPYTLAALKLAQQLLGASIPPEVLERLATSTPHNLRQRIDGLGLADVLKRTQQKPITNLRQRLTRGLTDRAQIAAWAPDLQGQWQVWSTALNFLATDTGQMLVGRKSKVPVATDLSASH